MKQIDTGIVPLFMTSVRDLPDSVLIKISDEKASVVVMIRSALSVTLSQRHDAMVASTILDRICLLVRLDREAGHSVGKVKQGEVVRGLFSQQVTAI